MDRSPRFSRRLLLSQAQALGMLAVLASEIEKIDPNHDRKVWLRRVSNDFGKMHETRTCSISGSPPRDSTSQARSGHRPRDAAPASRGGVGACSTAQFDPRFDEHDRADADEPGARPRA